MSPLIHSSWASRWVFIIMTTIINAITTNPDSALPGSYCRLSTPWSLQHRGKWCSNLPFLNETLIEVGKPDEHPRKRSSCWNHHTIINPIILNHNLGRASWWVRWWTRSEHRGGWRGNLAEALDRKSIEVSFFRRNRHFNPDGRASSQICIRWYAFVKSSWVKHLVRPWRSTSCQSKATDIGS